MDTKEEKPLNIYQRLVKARSLMSTVVMTGWNKFQSYTYASSSDILAVIKKGIDEAGVLMTTRIISHKEEYITAIVQDKEKQSLKISLEIEYRFINIDLPNEVEIFMWPVTYIETTPSEAIKGYAKAMTYAQKYFLVQQFLLPRDEDDPDQGDDNQTSQQRPVASQQTLSNKTTPTDGMERQSTRKTTPAQTTPAQTTPVVNGKEKQATKAEQRDQEEKYFLRAAINSMARDHKVDVQTAESIKQELGLSGQTQDMTQAQLERLKEYLLIKILIKENGLSNEDLVKVMKKVSPTKNIAEMATWQLSAICKNLLDMIEQQKKASDKPLPSADNIPDEMLPDKITSENVESKLAAIAESAEATVEIDDGKKK